MCSHGRAAGSSPPTEPTPWASFQVPKPRRQRRQRPDVAVFHRWRLSSVSSLQFPPPPCFRLVQRFPDLQHAMSEEEPKQRPTLVRSGRLRCCCAGRGRPSALSGEMQPGSQSSRQQPSRSEGRTRVEQPGGCLRGCGQAFLKGPVDGGGGWCWSCSGGELAGVRTVAASR